MGKRFSDEWLTDIIRYSWQEDYPAPEMTVEEYISRYSYAESYLENWQDGRFWECILDFLGVFGNSPVLLYEDSRKEYVEEAVAMAARAVSVVLDRQGWNGYPSHNISLVKEIEDTFPEDERSENLLGSMETSLSHNNSRMEAVIHHNFAWTGHEDTAWHVTLRLVFHEFRHSLQHLDGILASTSTKDPLHPCEVDARFFQQNLFNLLFSNYEERQLRGGFEYLEGLRQGDKHFDFTEDTATAEDYLNRLLPMCTGSLRADSLCTQPFISHFRNRVQVFAFIRHVHTKVAPNYTPSMEELQEALKLFNEVDRGPRIAFIGGGAPDWYQARIEEYRSYVFQRMAEIVESHEKETIGRSYLIQAVLCASNALRFNPEARLCKYIGIYLWQYQATYHPAFFFREYAWSLMERVYREAQKEDGPSLTISREDYNLLQKMPKGFAGALEVYEKYKPKVEVSKQSDLALDFYLFCGMNICIYPEWIIDTEIPEKDEISLADIDIKESPALAYLSGFIICQRWIEQKGRRKEYVFGIGRLSLSMRDTLNRILFKAPLFTDPWPETEWDKNQASRPADEIQRLKSQIEAHRKEVEVLKESHRADISTIQGELHAVQRESAAKERNNVLLDKELQETKKERTEIEGTLKKVKKRYDHYRNRTSQGIICFLVSISMVVAASFLPSLKLGLFGTAGILFLIGVGLVMNSD